MSIPPVPASRNRLVWLAVLAVSAIALIPIWSVAIVPTVDYPNHLARMHILVNLDRSPELQAIYRTDWGLVPNLVMDILVPPLASVVPLFTAGKLFVSAIVVLWIAGPMVLHRVLFGRPSLWPLAAGFFVYNHSLSTGLMNYCFGAGVYFFVVAAWMATTAWRPLPRLLLGSVLSLALFFCHLYVVALYGLTIAALEVGYLLRHETGPAADAAGLGRLAGRWAVAFGQFAAPAAVLLLFSPTGDVMAASAGAEPMLRLVFGPLSQRLISIRSPVWIDIGPFDYVVLLSLAAGFGLALLGRALRVHRDMAPVLLGLTVIGLLMPDVEGLGLLVRFLPVIAALAFASSRLDLAARRFPARAVLLLFATMFILRMAVVVERWQAVDRQFAEFRSALAVVERGSALLPIVSGFGSMDPFRLGGQPPQKLFWNLGQMAIIERDVFTPFLFTVRGQQIVQPRERYLPIAVPDGMLIDSDALRRLAAGETVPDQPRLRPLIGWPAHFDYVAVIDSAGRPNPLPERLRAVHAGSYFTIYRVVPPAAGDATPAPAAAQPE